MKPIIFANGCFDILHAGHFRFLRYCVAMKKFYDADKFVLALDSDEKVNLDKGENRPIFTLEERKKHLRYAFPEIDFVHSFDTNPQLEDCIKYYHPNVILIKDERWRSYPVGAHWAKEILYFHTDKLLHISTSEIVRRATNAQQDLSHR